MNYGCCVQPNLGMFFPLLGITAVHQESAGERLCAFLGNELKDLLEPKNPLNSKLQEKTHFPTSVHGHH